MNKLGFTYTHIEPTTEFGEGDLKINHEEADIHTLHISTVDNELNPRDGSIEHWSAPDELYIYTEDGPGHFAILERDEAGCNEDMQSFIIRHLSGPEPRHEEEVGVMNVPVIPGPPGPAGDSS